MTRQDHRCGDRLSAAERMRLLIARVRWWVTQATQAIEVAMRTLHRRRGRPGRLGHEQELPQS
eukprot:11803555-Alexandrium_andersonii.AAC.1